MGAHAVGDKYHDYRTVSIDESIVYVKDGIGRHVVDRMMVRETHTLVCQTCGFEQQQYLDTPADS